MIADRANRERIVKALATTFLVEAAAGTGKTTVLVQRIVETLAGGEDVASVAALTFTDKAAGELKLRLRAGLETERRAATGPRRRHLEAALARLEEAQVSTLHTFAQELLRERPVEAGVDPRFSPCSDGEARALFDEVFSRWLERALGRPTAALRRALARPNVGARELAFAARDLSEHRMLSAPWTRRPWDRAAAVRALREAATRAASTDTTILGRYDLVAEGLDAVKLAARRMERAGDELAEGIAIELCRNVRVVRALEKGRGAPYAKEVIASLVREIQAFEVLASADLAFELRGELSAVVASYEAEKARRGWVDMQDLIARTHVLLRSDEALRLELASRYGRIFVDEFQDTDAIQVAILMMLASEDAPTASPFDARIAPGKLFVVGDPKQSIYRFRQADLAVYEAVRTSVVASGGEVVTLTSSFRATPPIQTLVNVAFEAAMRGDDVGVQARYVPLAETRAANERQPAVIALPVPRPYGARRLARSAIQKSLPDAVAAFVAWLVEESGFTVYDPRTEAEVPVSARHVAILFSKTKAYQSSLVAPIAKGLSERGVPHVALGSVGLSETEEGRALSNALRAIERTDDALSVYATLHGPLFGFDDATLFDYATWLGGGDAVARIDPLRAKPEETPEPLRDVASALELVARLHRARNRRPTAETLHELLEATRAHVAFALSPTSEQALLVVASLERRAASHDHRGGLSFRSFVAMLEDDDRGRELTDDESQGVRIMTVHAAKGLEFPVVVLADPTSKPRAEVDRVVDVRNELAALRLAGMAPWELVERAAKEQAAILAESVRLAYVAATRARDLLVVPIVGDEPTFPDDGWLAPLQRVLVPLDPSRSEQAPLCPIMGADLVLERPEPARKKLAPGLYTTKAGPIAFFDPKVLEAPRRSIRGKLDLVAKDAAPEASAEEERAHDRVLSERAGVVVRGAAPSLEVTTATALSHAGAVLDTPSVEVDVHTVARVAGRPGGRRFGTVVHAILAVTKLDASPNELAAAARAFGRLHGATDAEVEAAAEAVRGALASLPMLEARRAASSGKLRREVPIAWEIEPSRIVDGVVDLAYFVDGLWRVVDYKTDDPGLLAPENLAAYRAQVSLYVGAIAAATGEPAKGALLFV